ncbi:hypothetical protein [Streptomyces sp. NPDC001275]
MTLDTLARRFVRKPAGRGAWPHQARGYGSRADALCLRHSLTLSSVPFGTWSQDQAEAFVTAVLLYV